MKPIRKHLNKPNPSSKLVLEEIIGLTTKNQNGLSSCLSTSHFFYLAGCIVVSCDVDSGSQSHLIVSHRAPKPLTCVSVSKDGRFVAAGESGNQPAVLVWNCSTLTLVSELKGHLYGVECIAFSPDGEHLVSVGGYIYLWNWKTGELVTKLKVSSSSSAITSVSFSLDAKFIVTAGRKHLKFWAVGSSLRTHLNKRIELPALHGKPVDLGPQKGSSFVSVASTVSANSAVANSEKVGDLFAIYALTSEGVLCLLDDSLSVKKSVDLRVQKGFALSASDKLIACACCNGAVLVFIRESLQYAGKLPYSKAKSIQGDTDTLCHTRSIEKDADISTLPDALACQFSASGKLVIIYGDHNLHIWDIHDVNMATRCYVSGSHSACIWDVKNLCCENMHDPYTACVARGCSGGASFTTCSADGSIRLWDLSLQLDVAGRHSNHFSSNTRFMNASYFASSGIFERDSVETGVSSQGLRSIASSSDGKYLAAGDCEGNLHIYNLLNSDYTCFQGVHEAEILTMSFSSLGNKTNSDKVVDGNYWLATGGRDRMIHIYDVKRNFDIIGSIDDHSAAVTSIKLIDQGCKILSCSADRSLVFRDVAVTDNGLKILRRHHQMASNGTIYDMAVDPTMEFVFTVGQDKKINIFDIASGKLTKLFKQDKDFGDPIKVTMDPSCSYLICSYSDKSICMYDIFTGETVAHSMGHGEVITGVIFLPDCKHVVSVSGDSCIFVWKLPTYVSSRILQRIKERSAPLSPTKLSMLHAFSQFNCLQKEDQLSKINAQDELLENSIQVGKKVLNQGSQKTPSFRFSISRLPPWAQTKVANSSSAIKNTHLTSSLPHQLVELKVVSPVFNGGEKLGPASCEVQISPGHAVGDTGSCLSSSSKGSSETTDDQNSSTPEETLRCSSMDKCWRKVYTVYLDLLNSPEVKNLMDMKLAASSSNLKTINSNSCCIRQADRLLDDRYGAFSKLQASSSNFGCQHDDQFGMCNSKFHDYFSGHAEEKLHMDQSNIQEAESTELDASHAESEGSDLFKQHFSSLSAVNKVETSKSSTKRKYSARYILRQDRHEGCKRLFSTPAREATPKITSENPMSQNDNQDGSAFEEDLKNSIQYISISSNDIQQEESSECLLAEKLLNCNVKQSVNQKECLSGSSLQQRITECQGALHNLDIAADNVLHLFSELGALTSAEKISNGPEAELCEEAVKLLPSIAEKLNAVVKMVESSGFRLFEKGSNEVSGFETMLGSFAESLSQRVVEVLKSNLIKDELLHSA